MIITLIVIIVLILLIKIIYNPKLDETCTHTVVLWFGKPGDRKYIELWQN